MVQTAKVGQDKQDMLATQSEENMCTFYQSREEYQRTWRLGWLMCGVALLCAFLSCAAGLALLGTYTHVFTFYLKWQDALVALLWFVTLLALCGSVLILRFLYTARIGYQKGVFSLVDHESITVRDISAINLASIFWMLNAAFWCFIVVLIGLVPVILIGWTLHITTFFLAVVATIVAVVLSIAGIVLSIVFAVIISTAIFASIALWQKLGKVYTYKLDTHTIIRYDGHILTVIYPDMPESMLDLKVLSGSDRQRLLALLHESSLASDNSWTLAFDTAIEQHTRKAKTTLASRLFRMFSFS